MKEDLTNRKKILNYMNGQLSPAEEAELAAWINNNSANHAYFNHIKNSVDPDEIKHHLLKSSYDELKSKLLINQQFKSNTQNRIRRLSFSISRIAAVLFLFMAFGFMVSYFIMNKASVNPEVVWFETYSPRGEKSQLLLPDGSKVWLNSETSLSYPSNFTKGNRKVKLAGEAFFEVTKQNGSEFNVETKDYDVRVLGTKFNVMAYADFDRTETSLIEGKVQIVKGQQKVDITPGQVFIYTGKKFYIKEKNANRNSVWRDQIFDFDHITFEDLLTRLERWYNVDIEIKNQELNDIIYSGVFKNEETIWQVLDVLQVTMPIKYERTGFRKFTIEMK